MTEKELRAIRERLGAGRAEIAARAGVTAEDLERWEASGVPRASAYRLDCVLWEMERDAALAGSGLPACDWVARFAARPEAARDPWTLEQHIGKCPVCQARGRYLEQHVRPRPLAPWLAWMPRWLRSALIGAFLALVGQAAVVAVVILLVYGLIAGDATLLVAGAGLFVICAFSGGVGGGVHFLTKPLRRRGFLGRFLGWTLVLEAYLFAVAGWVVLGALLRLGGLGPDEQTVLVHPLFWLALTGAGVLAGLVAAVVVGK